MEHPQPETTTIDGLEVTSTQFAAMRGFALCARLGHTIGPAFMHLMLSDDQADVAELVPAMVDLCAKVDAQGTGLLLELLANTVVVVTEADGTAKQISLGTAASIDLVFTGKLAALLHTAVFAIRVNYKNFISGVLTMGKEQNNTPETVTA